MSGYRSVSGPRIRERVCKGKCRLYRPRRSDTPPEVGNMERDGFMPCETSVCHAENTIVHKAESGNLRGSPEAENPGRRNAITDQTAFLPHDGQGVAV